MIFKGVKGTVHIHKIKGKLYKYLHYWENGKARSMSMGPCGEDGTSREKIVYVPPPPKKRVFSQAAPVLQPDPAGMPAAVLKPQKIDLGRFGDGHDWQKTNLVTNKNMTDSYQCERCGAKGTRHGFAPSIRVSKRGDGQCDAIRRKAENEATLEDARRTDAVLKTAEKLLSEAEDAGRIEPTKTRTRPAPAMTMKMKTGSEIAAEVVGDLAKPSPIRYGEHARNGQYPERVKVQPAARVCKCGETTHFCEVLQVRCLVCNTFVNRMTGFCRKCNKVQPSKTLKATRCGACNCFLK